MTDSDTVTRDELIGQLCTLVALERDRELGYQHDELHADPQAVIEETLRVLERAGQNPHQVVWPEDQDTLGIDV